MDSQIFALLLRMRTNLTDVRLALKRDDKEAAYTASARLRDLVEELEGKL